MIDVATLRAAVRKLDLARERQAAVAEKVEAAGKQAAEARAKRRAALERAALGLDADLAKYRRALDDAESAITAYAAAADIAQKAVDTAEAGVAGIFRAHLRQLEAEAQARLDAAEVQFTEATRARAAASEALAAARRTQFSDSKLHSLFAKEISEARDKVPEQVD